MFMLCGVVSTIIQPEGTADKSFLFKRTGAAPEEVWAEAKIKSAIFRTGRISGGVENKTKAAPTDCANSLASGLISAMVIRQPCFLKTEAACKPVTPAPKIRADAGLMEAAAVVNCGAIFEDFAREWSAAAYPLTVF